MGWLIPIIVVVVGLAAAFGIARLVTTAIIYPPAVGLHYRDGRFVRVVPPGRYMRIDPLKRTRIVTVSTIQLPSPGEIPVISSDQFAFKLVLAPAITVTDPQLFHETQPALDPNLFYILQTPEHPIVVRELAAAAVAVVGAMRLPEILADPKALPVAIETAMAGRIPGATVDRILVTAINLPPETRKMFTEVERAKLESLAGIERARGEQAAMRVLANAARSMNDNPALANLRLLKAIEASKGPTTIVLGNPPTGFGPA